MKEYFQPGECFIWTYEKAGKEFIVHEIYSNKYLWYELSAPFDVSTMQMPRKTTQEHFLREEV